MNPTTRHELEVRFRTAGAEASSTDFHLRQLQRLLRAVSVDDRLLKDTEWLIATGVRDTSYLYAVFDTDGPTAAALAVLREDDKEYEGVVRSFALWNGQEERAKGASISCRFDRYDGLASSLRLSMKSARGTCRLGAWERVADALKTAACIYEPIYCSVETPNYEAVFKDRPGVGWMLYLPRVLTAQQVPEARALVPVMTEGDGKKQKPAQVGTIIVSVTDEPFSDENPEHVKIANAIEIRLVDQDLLPRYAEL